MKKLTSGISLLACLISISCSTYTKGLQQSVGRANEIAAAATLRSVAMAQQAYSVGNDGEFGTFPQLVEGGYLDSSFKDESPKLKDYQFTMTVISRSETSPEASFSCNADPVRKSEMGGRHLYVDSSSPEIRVNAAQAAGASDPPFQP